MTNKLFEFAVEPNTDKNPPRQMQKLTVLRDMAYLQNAVNELQDRVAGMEIDILDLDKNKTESIKE